MTDEERDELRWRLLTERWAEAKAQPEVGTWRVYCAVCSTTTHVGQLVPIEGCQTLINGWPSCRCPGALTSRNGLPVLEVMGMGDAAFFARDAPGSAA